MTSDRRVIADVVDAPGREARRRIGRRAVPAGIGLRRTIDQPHDGLGHVVDIGEVALHVAVVEQADRLALQNRLREQPHRHVGPAPRPVHSEETQAGRRNAKQVRISVRHQLVRLLGRAVKAERMIDVLAGAERRHAVAAVDRGRRRVEKVLRLRLAAAFQDVEKADEVRIRISVRLDQRMAHAGLRGEMNDLRKRCCGE